MSHKNFLSLEFILINFNKYFCMVSLSTEPCISKKIQNIDNDQNEIQASDCT